MKSTRDLFRENLREIISERGIKLEKAAELCDVSLSFLNQLLSGKSAYSPETLDKICKGLKCTPVDLFYVEPKNQEEAKVRTGAPLEMVTNQRLELITLIGSLSDSQVAALVGPIKSLIRLQAPINKDKPGS